ncbi:MAG: glycosyltransferase [Verrucomicrobiota bacterium]|nr:glycosyltransferase [Verrucomicrobiota bacterium]
MIFWLTATSCFLALVPALLFLKNLRLYARLPQAGIERARCSVLIPARDEEANIAAALRSVLQSTGVDFEVVVLDDDSSDRTAEIVREFVAADARVRLETAPALPTGWCGKNFACHQLASLARHPLLIFMDADVRISRADSLARLAEFVERSGAALVSGVPHEETRSLMEKLIIPLIHFVLLGFLPLQRMRSGTDPRFAAACGQILAVRREAYESAGGHAAIRDRIHDAVALTRNFRAHGFKTDLFDGTDTFQCRMYSNDSEVWNGFAKNAHEGLGSTKLIVPATLILFGGQVLPFLLLALAPSPLIFVAVLLALLPRVLAVVRFRQSFLGALLHPIGIALLLSIQGTAFLGRLRFRPAVWRGRAYSRIEST